MRYYQDEIDLTTMFTQGFRALYPLVPIEYSGVEFTIPAEGMFARFSVSRLPDSKFIATEGNRKHYRAYGSVLVQLLVKSGEGVAALMQAADQVSEIFRHKREQGLVTRVPSVGPLVGDGNRQWVVVSTPFTSDYFI